MTIIGMTRGVTPMSEEVKKEPRKVFDLLIDEKKETIDEVFGGSYEVLSKIREDMVKWLIVEKHESYTQALADFLESDLFKKHKWEPKTPNDYFLIGWMFSAAKYKYRKTMNALQKAEADEGDLRPCDLLRLLRGR